MNPEAEILERGRRGIESSKRLNAIVCIVLGAVFGVFALGCFAGAAATVFAGAPVGAAVGVGVFGLFWCALTALLLGLGLRGLGRLRRDARLRTSGVRGKATVLSYVESSFKVDGATKFQLSLRVEIEGRPPWDVSLNEAVMRGGSVYQGATLPVFVNPADPSELMIDWFAPSRA